MMYAKLALRNVKRSAKDYLIYVITLILSVGLFYGFMSIASPYYNESLPVKINLEILNKAMRIAVPIVALLVVFLISYVNTYMLRRKQKEFAVQTIIGMEQRTVAFIFFVETMIMGAISIIFGILLGIGLSQIVGYIVVQSFGVEWQPYLSLFPDTILFTLLFFGAIFIVMGIKNIRTVRQLKIIDMLHNSQRGNEKFTLYTFGHQLLHAPLFGIQHAIDDLAWQLAKQDVRVKRGSNRARGELLHGFFVKFAVGQRCKEEVVEHRVRRILDDAVVHQSFLLGKHLHLGSPSIVTMTRGSCLLTL